MEIYLSSRQLFRPNLSQTPSLFTREFHPNHDITNDCPRNFFANIYAINFICHCGSWQSFCVLVDSKQRWGGGCWWQASFYFDREPRIILYARNKKLIEFTWHFSEAQPLRLPAEKKSAFMLSRVRKAGKWLNRQDLPDIQRENIFWWVGEK